MSAEFEDQSEISAEQRNAAADWIGREIRPIEQFVEGQQLDSESQQALQEEYLRLSSSIAENRDRAIIFEGLAARSREQADLDTHTLVKVGHLLGEQTPAQPNLLKGDRIIDVLLGLLPEDRDPEEPMHYSALYRVVRNAGFFVSGKDPVATFLTALSRSPITQGMGSRSGLYKINGGNNG